MRKVAVNICRFLLAAVFLFSGFVKAVDPMGGAYKILDYIAASPFNGMNLPQWIVVGSAAMLASFEFILGIFLFFGFHKRVTTRATLAFMAVMTLLTAWVWIVNPVKDCGCFGDAIVLANSETFVKNIILLFMAIVISIWRNDVIRLISKHTQWIVTNYSLLFIIAVCSISLYDLPIIDFRPYHIGANFRTDMDIPPGEEGPTFETTFILEKDGKQQEFTIDNYPDSTWTFIDSKTVKTKEGYVPPIHDFSIEDHAAGDDITDSIVKRDGFTFLLVAPDIATADDANFGEIDLIYEYAIDNKHLFCAVTASNSAAKQAWRDRTGAEYPFYFCDHTTLKTIVRSNPGLLLIHDGVIVGKWSHNLLPSLEKLDQVVDKAQKATILPKTTTSNAITMLLWFVIPLCVLTLADRLWAWTKWIKGATQQEKETITKQLKHTDNEKKDCGRQLENES